VDRLPASATAPRSKIGSDYDLDLLFDCVYVDRGNNPIITGDKKIETMSAAGQIDQASSFGASNFINRVVPNAITSASVRTIRPGESK
jgi:hypothetical protein